MKFVKVCFRIFKLIEDYLKSINVLHKVCYGLLKFIELKKSVYPWQEILAHNFMICFRPIITLQWFTSLVINAASNKVNTWKQLREKLNKRSWRIIMNHLRYFCRPFPEKLSDPNNEAINLSLKASAAHTWIFCLYVNRKLVSMPIITLKMAFDGIKTNSQPEKLFNLD